MRIPKATFYPCHPTNYTKGRRGRSIKYFTVHHTVANNSTLRYLWGNADRNGSSHLFVGEGYFEQYVDTDDTAWTNGNFTSNTESITCEVRGDWRYGYYNAKTLATLEEAMYQVIKLYPKIQLRLTYHMDVSNKSTLCPADLKHKGYAKRAWDNAQKRAVENPANLRLDIPDKKVVLIEDTNVWDMSFRKWGDAKAVTALKKGTVIDVAGIYDHPLSKVDYYLSRYSWERNLNNGISIASCKDWVEPPPKPPANTKPVDNPNKPDSQQSPAGGAGEIPVINVDPNGEKLNQILDILKYIKALLERIFK